MLCVVICNKKCFMMENDSIMTNKYLKKFTRKELLEVMVSQAEEIERLQNQLRLANEKLDSREICIKNVGSIAEAALQLNHIFQDADAAGQQYLDSIKKMVTMEKETLKRIEEKERVLQSELEKLRDKRSAQIEFLAPSLGRRNGDES